MSEGEPARTSPAIALLASGPALLPLVLAVLPAVSDAPLRAVAADVLLPGLVLGAAAACAVRSRRRPADRLAWMLLGAGLLSWAAGELLQDVLPGAVSPRSPSPADAGRLGLYPLAYAGLGLLALGRLRQIPRSMWLDGVSSAVATAAVGAAFVVPDLEGGEDAAALVLAMACTVGDLGLVALALGLFAVTGFGAWAPRPGRDAALRSVAVAIVPVACTACAVGILVYDAGSRLQEVHDVAVYLSAVAILLALGRTVLTVHELRALTATRRLALTDDLTGLANRRALLRALEGDVAAGRAFALLLIDLDRFKEINDQLGHHVGDLLLRQLGPRMARTLDARDLLARLGGDEFAVILADVRGEAGARAAAEELRAALEAPFDLQCFPVHVDASVGVVLHSSAGDRSAAGLLQDADVAMYRAKRDGSGVHLHVACSTDGEPNHLEVAAELRAGIAAGELELHFQPQVAADGGELVGVEALVRWRHPQRGLLYPDAFLPAVAQTSVMRLLTERVIADALERTVAWREQGLLVPVAVNVSATSLLDPGFADAVAAQLERTGAPASLLRVEVTENAVMTDMDRAMAVLDRLRDLGVELALDDFGTGHSSLQRLKDLPVDELKIDRSFVMAMEDDHRDAAIVQAAIDLGLRLGLRVVAEGVETASARRRLAELGCDVLQGYDVARPLTAPALHAWIARRGAVALA